MSGGAHNYAYVTVQNFAQQLRHGSPQSLERMAFAELLDRVAKAMYDIEWVDSGDKGKGDELAAIRACLAPGTTLAMARQQAEEAVAQLQRLLGEAG